MLTKHHRVWRLTSRVKTTPNNLNVTTQLPISHPEAWAQELFFLTLWSRPSRQDSYLFFKIQVFSSFVQVDCFPLLSAGSYSMWKMHTGLAWFYVKVPDPTFEFGRTGAVAVAGPLGQLQFQSILKAKPFYVIGWSNENIAKFCRISTSFILISPLASQAGWKIDGLHNSEMHLFDLDLCFGLKIQGNTSSPFFLCKLKVRLQEHIFGIFEYEYRWRL